MKYAALMIIALLSTTSVQAVEVSTIASPTMCPKVSTSGLKSFQVAQNRQPRCCGQCTNSGRSGCWMNINGQNYCSPC